MTFQQGRPVDGVQMGQSSGVSTPIAVPSDLLHQCWSVEWTCSRTPLNLGILQGFGHLSSLDFYPANIDFCKRSSLLPFLTGVEP
jgi:hypothetical protein